MNKFSSRSKLVLLFRAFVFSNKFTCLDYTIIVDWIDYHQVVDCGTFMLCGFNFTATIVYQMS